MGLKSGEVLLREGIVLCLLLLQMPPPPRLYWHLQLLAQERCWGTRSRLGGKWG